MSVFLGGISGRSQPLIERPCDGCKRMVLMFTHLCQDCTEQHLENLAVVFDPTYDRTQMNDWNRLWKCFKGYYWQGKERDDGT